MRLTSLSEPFDHPDWLFELKYDGFRSVAVVGSGGTQLISRHLNVYKSFGNLCSTINRDLKGRSAILDGEIVCLDRDGRPVFNDLLRRRTPQYFYAFDLLELDGRSLRSLALLQRKLLLRNLIHPQCERLLYVDHVHAGGVDLYRAACAANLEGIVAKWKRGAYFCGHEQPQNRRLALHAADPARASRLTWVKVKNPDYTQIAGRNELFQARVAARR
jgi:bifunctional non-homologous end joining protein LigD